MVKAIVDISENANRVLNIVKARHSLKTKSEAINMMSEIYEETFEPELRPEFVKEMLELQKNGKFIHFKSMEEFDKYIHDA
ncbi:DUF2683 family protein [Candidatus Woesearchaeota archaeon]|nr:DUF2683 family protein [Candidatus Woesearchaeota archaeon]